MDDKFWFEGKRKKIIIMTDDDILQVAKCFSIATDQGYNVEPAKTRFYFQLKED